MTTFRLNVLFTGVDFDDDDVFVSLAELPHIVWRAQGGVAYASAVVESTSALKGADLVTRQVIQRVPSARPLQLDEDLVAIPDIASRVSMTREAVRNWANGKRHANFPMPRGVVGDGIKVWAWADVNCWLRENLGLGDAEDFPSAHDFALINALFRATPQPHVSAEAVTWSVAERLTVSTETSAAIASAPKRWVRTTARRGPYTAIDRGLNAAA